MRIKCEGPVCRIGAGRSSAHALRRRSDLNLSGTVPNLGTVPRHPGE